jgi:Nucleotide modification associated domain 3
MAEGLCPRQRTAHRSNAGRGGSTLAMSQPVAHRANVAIDTFPDLRHSAGGVHFGRRLYTLLSMRIIFSRKGFDSSYGGVPSPILNGIPISLPIPLDQPSETTYADLGLGPLVENLTKGRIRSSRACHFDPDLERGAFGQEKSAQGHLRRQGVCAGDLFLFFGLFRAAERVGGAYRFVPGAPRQHRLFGWLQIGEVVALGEDGSGAVRRWPHLARHPHVRPGWHKTNTLYVAAPQLKLPGDSPTLPGFGLFRSDAPALCLSCDERKPSLWRVPSWLGVHEGGVRLSYHEAPARWADRRLQSVAKGQEFVADIDGHDEAHRWLRLLIANTSPVDPANDTPFARPDDMPTERQTSCARAVRSLPINKGEQT